MIRFDKNKIKSLRFLIFFRLIIYLAIITIIFSLFFFAVSDMTFSKLSNNFLRVLDINMNNYEDIDEKLLFDNSISLEVVDSNLNVIYSKGYILDRVERYTPVELVSIVDDDNYEYNIMATNITSADGQELTLIYKQYFTNKVIKNIGKNMLQYILILVTGSILLLMLSYILLTRNIFKSIKKEFDFIQKNISRTPYDRSKLDLSTIPLLETREVAKSYNNMLDEMEKIKQEKDRLVKKNNRLISNLSHDLKSPITSLMGYWDIITRKDISTKDREQYAQYIDNSIRDLNQLSAMLFDQLKYHHGEYNLTLKQDDLNNLLRDICANYYMLYEKKGFTMNVEIEEKPFITAFDSLHMRRVFTNILDNCLKHNPESTKMSIITESTNDMLKIYFKDTGTGIHTEDKEHIFDAFYQGDEARTENHGGLGLYIVRQIILKHGGEISLIDDENYSTVFEITIPKRAQ